ncbi:sugar phosphate isomerase/epimerase and 4-hydroxyphenylpyruvate domain-containing protein [Sphingomonas donggukensis]|uniref:3-dehydroshikimate dehydratase n=1 Tax=Sphingomonas donggukensis TaxID=2949093 RepID=A0ABY4TX33_9SPHN|nr:sugar phosphate isomerase/epimerase and 4-hydroxyphenylpyruvate domain-containing protein [Sphingomonas donggukensis]URW75096.1 sugar phosphate isomerase/epimerase and 4-hydroxyphenylpyruvate domain-containing protein [Sphingomonas donggukensis]
MKTAIATVSISGTLEEKLVAVARAGFLGVEIFENDLITFPGSPADIRAMLADLGLSCPLFQPFRDFEGMPSELRERALQRAARKFSVMRELGTDLVLVCSNCSPLALGDRARIIDDFGALGELAAKHGVRIGYEALAWGRHVNDHREAWSIVRDVDHPNVGLILDSFHSLARGIPSASIGDVRANKLFFVQVADAPRFDMDLLQWSRHFRTMPGQGDLALEEWAEAIWRTGYDGWWSLEIFNDRFRAASGQLVARDGARSLIALRDTVARRPRPAVPASIAPPVAPSHVSFIEFAVSEDEAEQLRSLMSALGFCLTGRHKRKAVERWAQGAINLIVNTEPEGFAHSFDIMHGGSVCAIGLVVADVAAVLDRATALGIDLFRQAVAPDEHAMPSLRGVGGSLIYLLSPQENDQIWRDEFIGIDRPEEQDCARLMRVDHIAYTMHYEEFLSWVLFFVAQFGMEKTPLVEISDPLGLVQSQAVETADRAVRFTLNGSNAQQTLSSRFVQNYFGAGAQHIAFATDDIVAAARAADAAGLERLPIPQNYYDDLIARFALPDELVETMAAYHILYDRDDRGEYFQFYSRAFGKRVFFEVVERRGYDGYGAANASIRLAAQARYKAMAT